MNPQVWWKTGWDVDIGKQIYIPPWKQKHDRDDLKMLREGFNGQGIFGWEREVCESKKSPVSWVFEGEKWWMRKTCWSKRPPLYKIQWLALSFRCHMWSFRNQRLNPFVMVEDGILMYNFIWSMYGISTFIYHKHQLNMYLTSILWVIASPSFNTASTSLINKKQFENSWRTVFITRNKHATLKSLTSTSLETLETATQNVHMLIFKTSVRQKQPKNPQGHTVTNQELQCQHGRETWHCLHWD